MEMMDSIRQAVLGFGYGDVISEKTVYLDVNDERHNKGQSELQHANFRIAKCPKKRAPDGTVIKEMVDKIIISEMWRFAYKALASDKRCCVVLISSDGEYTNTISALRDVGVKVVVWHGGITSGSDNCVDVLTMAADSSSHFIQDILGMMPDIQNRAPASVRGSASSGDGHEDPTGGLDSDEDDTATVASIDGGRFIDLSMCVQRCQMKVQREQPRNHNKFWEDVWADGSQVYKAYAKTKNPRFYWLPAEKKDEIKAMYRARLEAAIQRRVILVGKRSRESTGDNSIIHEVCTISKGSKYHEEVYYMINPDRLNRSSHL